MSLIPTEGVALHLSNIHHIVLLNVSIGHCPVFSMRILKQSIGNVQIISLQTVFLPVNVQVAMKKSDGYTRTLSHNVELLVLSFVNNSIMPNTTDKLGISI